MISWMHRNHRFEPWAPPRPEVLAACALADRGASLLDKAKLLLRAGVPRALAIEALECRGFGRITATAAMDVATEGVA